MVSKSVVLSHFSALTLLDGRQEGPPACKSWLLVCCWWWFDWSFARLTAPVVTTTSVMLSYDKIQNADILVPASRGCLGKWLFNECCCCCCIASDYWFVKFLKLITYGQYYNQQKLYKPRTHTTEYQKSFIHRTIPEWNSLPSTVAQSDTVSTFKYRLSALP